MNTQKIFLITPLGSKQSSERQHETKCGILYLSL